MYFYDLQSRLIACLKTRLRNGELSERRLALLTGISQPHIHNVLKGARFLSLEMADQILRRLKISVVDLFSAEDLREALRAGALGAGSYGEVPVLEGWLGPGLPLPRVASTVERYPFPASFLTPLEKPLVARLAHDENMQTVRENDLVLLDQSPIGRLHLSSERLYVVNRTGEGLVRRVRAGLQHLYLLAERPAAEPENHDTLSLAGRHVLDIVRARVVWIGRSLDGL